MNLKRLFVTFVLNAAFCLLSGATLRDQTTPSPDNFKKAVEYSHSQHGTSVLVMVRGEILFEDYAPGWTAEKPHLLASGAKSFCGVTAACAVHDGLLTLDERVAETLVEWKDDPRKSRITIRQLLSLSSGIDGGDNGSVPSYKRSVSMAESSAEPGAKFSYGPIPFQCFGELMRRKLEPMQESVEAYLHRRVLDPIGMKVGFWRKDADGNINLPAGIFLTPREWAKFGELVRLEGKWKETEIVPAPLLAECFKPSTANPAYGMTWWLLGDGDESSTEAANGRNVEPKLRRVLEERRKLKFKPPADTVAAMGKGKNRCYVIPSLEMVIIRMGDSEGREFSDNEFLAKGNLTGARHNDPDFIWILYSDGPGNKGRGDSGVACLPEDDLLGLVGKHPADKDKSRWIAGLGHELGHAFGLPYPTDTEKYADAIMWLGIYGKYPDKTYLSDDGEKTWKTLYQVEQKKE